jgi:RNA recognition motif-containing protein
MNMNFIPPNQNLKNQNEIVLYVGNLHKFATDEMMFHEFSKYGTVKNCRVVREFNGNSKQFAYITFDNKKEAEEARKALNHKQIMGLEMKVDFKRDKKSFSQNANVFVKNLKTESPKELEELMMKFGTVISCIIKKNVKGESMGFGYVQFEKDDEAAEAIAHLNGKSFFGDVLTLELFTSDKYKNDKSTLYVKNFPTSWNLEQVQNFINNNFHSLGMVTSTVMMKKKNGANVYFAYLNFNDDKQAEDAIEKMNGTDMGDNLQLHTEIALSKKERTVQLSKKMNELESNCSLFLKGLNADLTEEFLREQIESIAHVVSLSLKKSTITDNNQNYLQFCFINFANNEDASKVFFELKKKVELQKFFHPLSLKKGDYVSFAQSKEIRQRYLKMKKNQTLQNMTKRNMLQMQYMQSHPQMMQMQNQMNMMNPVNNFMQMMPMNPEKSQNESYSDVKMNLKNLNLQNEEYDLEWIENNLSDFLSFDEEKKRHVLGKLMFDRISSLKNNEIEGLNDMNENISKITGMLIDLEILEIEEIINILKNQDELIERIKEALDVINEDQ